MWPLLVQSSTKRLLTSPPSISQTCLQPLAMITPKWALYGSIINFSLGSWLTILVQFDFTGSAITVRDDVVPTAHVAIAFEGASWSDADYVPFNILQSMIGSWHQSMGANNNLNSRLAEVVATNNIMTQFSAFNACYHRTGLFGVYFTCDYSRLDDACWQVFNELQKIGKGLTEAELVRAKNRVKAAYLMQLDDTQVFSCVLERIITALFTIHYYDRLFAKILVDKS